MPQEYMIVGFYFENKHYSSSISKPLLKLFTIYFYLHLLKFYQSLRISSKPTPSKFSEIFPINLILSLLLAIPSLQLYFSRIYPHML